MSEIPTPREELLAKLKELNFPDDLVSKLEEELGVTSIADLAVLTEADLVAIGMKPIPARTFVKALAPAQTDTTNSMAMGMVDDILPAPQSEESWLKALQTGGILKVDQSTFTASIRVAMAQRVHLFDLPDRLVKAMEKFADSNDEQVDPTYFTIRDQLTRKSYADIFSAIPGLNGNYVTEGRKKQLLERVDQYMWPAIASFQDLLKGWYDNWIGTSGQQAMMALMGGMLGGGAGHPMPPAMVPETGALRDQADAMADAANRVFAGTGVQITAALAYEASQIVTTLQDNRLPAMIGAANRDQMLRQLGSGIPATYARLETNLVRYVLGVLQLRDTPAGDEELRVLYALAMLGSQITWSALGVNGGGGYSTIGGKSEL